MGPMSYEGPEKYIFISYAHKDSDRVLRILERLTEAGYRIWYDDGIAPGSEWPEDIAEHLDGCAVFMAFVSGNSIASSNCRREVTFALSRQKDFLGIVLEPTKMSLGMEMQLSAQQCILRQNYRREEDFIQKIFSCPDLDCCRTVPEPEPVAETVEAPAPAPAPKPAPKPKKAPVQKKKKLSLPLLIAIIVLAAALVITPVVILVTSNLPLQVAEGVSVGRGEDSVSLRGKTITAETAQTLNRLENLEFLYFYDCTFEDGALDSLRLPGLVQFTVENAALTDFYFLMDSTKLTRLSLVNCGVADGNVPFDAFTNLQYLDLSNNPALTDLSAIPAEKLRNVNFSGTGVQDISALAASENLSEIYCANTPVSNIDALASLSHLKVMDFTNCRIKTADTPFMSLSLRELYMGGNGLDTAKGFENFTVLEKVYLGNNKLANVDWLSKSAAKLKEVDLRYNLLYGEDVPFLADCKNLTYLSICNVDMEDLTLVAGLSQLKTLVASDCGLTSVSGLSGLENLQRLYLDGNDLTDISGLPAVGRHNNAVLDLSYNRITSIAPLPDGTYMALSLIDNPIVYAPGDFDGLTGTRLYLYYDESLDTCGAADFNRVFLRDCPADKQLSLKKTLAGNMAYVSPEEMTAELESQGLSHPYAN